MHALPTPVAYGSANIETMPSSAVADEGDADEGDGESVLAVVALAAPSGRPVSPPPRPQSAMASHARSPSAPSRIARPSSALGYRYRTEQRH